MYEVYELSSSKIVHCELITLAVTCIYWENARRSEKSLFSSGLYLIPFMWLSSVVIIKSSIDARLPIEDVCD